MVEMHFKRNFKKCIPTIKGVEDKLHHNFEVGSEVHHWVQRCKLELYNTKSSKS
jgi:hypothetical protein